MLKIIKMEFFQFIRKPIWLSIFSLIIIFSIILPRASLTELSVVPGMVYFVMVISLFLSVYAAESARMEVSQHIEETLSTTPVFNKYLKAKLLYWLILSFLIYLLFYCIVIAYIAVAHRNVTIESVYSSFWYTLFCWFIPFYFSLILGYVIYKGFPSVFSYLLIILTWFLTMPYNSMIGIIPREFAGWLINGDPNIIEIFSTNPLENLSVNKGYYFQRTFMLILLLSIYLAVSFKRSLKIRGIATIILIAAVGIPLFSPYVPYITGRDSLDDAAISLEQEKELRNNYRILKYSFQINHRESNHYMSYSVDIDIEANINEIDLVLMEDFGVNSVSMNGQNILFERSGNLVKLKLPATTGVLTMKVETDSFIGIGPTTIQLLATSPWYPMHPVEAMNTYEDGTKEQYELRWDTSRSEDIITNLKKKNDHEWAGKAYGPTILLGKYKNMDKIVFPAHEPLDRIERMNKGVVDIFDEYNKKYNATAHLPEHVYYVTTFYGMQANPEEAYIYPRVFPKDDILRLFYSGKGG